ncbi:MAG TPA: TIGR00730 family Rossman fold protein [Bacteroidales bacterium]|nr:TIGR00730 family Rossman fold protein [Bacteroidales bacterium]HPS27274.1 TIGR00730 family Rossman fold protein [Bacteroidales bacterium]
MKNIAVFCGSSAGSRPVYGEKARLLGKLFVKNGFSLVYGSGNVGLMGIMADSMLEEDGEVIGVIPQRLVDVEVAHKHISRTHIVATMSERKMLIEQLSDAFIILPGGMGTLDEFFEMLTLGQLGIIKKPIGVFNIEGYFDKMLSMLDYFIEERFMRPEHKELFFVSDDENELIERLKTFQPSETVKWLENFKHTKF